MENTKNNAPPPKKIKNKNKNFKKPSSFFFFFFWKGCNSLHSIKTQNLLLDRFQWEKEDVS